MHTQVPANDNQLTAIATSTAPLTVTVVLTGQPGIRRLFQSHESFLAIIAACLSDGIPHIVMDEGGQPVVGTLRACNDNMADEDGILLF